MKKKGFTLIELLAVIVILAVIALIATPIILGVINKTEQNAFKNSVYGVYDAIDYYYATNLSETDLDKEFNFSKTVPLKYKGEKMVSGKITIDEKGNKIVSFVTNGKYCANGKNNDIEVSDDCISLDETKAIIDESKIGTTSTTNSITVILGEGFAVDEESGIKGYEYIIKKDDKEINRFKTTDITYTFEGLTHNTEYEIIIKVTNNNNKVNEVTIKASTLTISKPTISFTNTPNELQNGYLKKQVATITYVNENVTNPIYYIKTSRAGTGSISGTPCGTGTNPGTCSGTATTSYAASTWYKVSGNVSVTYSEASDTTGTIYAAVGDGINLPVMSTGKIDKIDTTAPTAPILGTVNNYGKSLELEFALGSDEQSDIATHKCYYGTSNNPTTEGTISGTKCYFNNLNQATLYYYKVCAINNLGLESCSNVGSTTTYTGLVAGTYQVGSKISYGGLNWYVLGDTGSAKGSHLKLVLDGVVGCGSTYNNANTYLNGTFLTTYNSIKLDTTRDGIVSQGTYDTGAIVKPNRYVTTDSGTTSYRPGNVYWNKSGYVVIPNLVQKYALSSYTYKVAGAATNNTVDTDSNGQHYYYAGVTASTLYTAGQNVALANNMNSITYTNGGYTTSTGVPSSSKSRDFHPSSSVATPSSATLPMSYKSYQHTASSAGKHSTTLLETYTNKSAKQWKFHICGADYWMYMTAYNATKYRFQNTNTGTDSYRAYDDTWYSFAGDTAYTNRTGSSPSYVYEFDFRVSASCTVYTAYALKNTSSAVCYRPYILVKEAYTN